VLLDHRVDREVLPHLPQHLEVPQPPQPVQVVHQQRPVAHPFREVQHLTEDPRLRLDVRPHPLLGHQLPLGRLPRRVPDQPRPALLPPRPPAPVRPRPPPRTSPSPHVPDGPQIPPLPPPARPPPVRPPSRRRRRRTIRAPFPPRRLPRLQLAGHTPVVLAPQ